MRTDRAAILAVGILSLGLSLLLLGPALAPGYVLAYDMVWVPDLALRPDFLGTGSALPRAVPADAVIAVIDGVVPGMVLQKAMLLGSLVSAGIGHGRLLIGLGRAPMLVGATVAVWNPFVVERLWLGHWTMLLAYAVLPWVLLLATRARCRGRIPRGLPLLALIGSLSAGAGLLVGVAILAAGLRRGVIGLQLTLITLAANLPWIVAGLLHRAAATSSAEAAEAFATRSEGWLPLPLTVVSLGGVWNRDVIPSSRETFVAVIGFVLLFGLVIAGARRWWRRPGELGRRGPLVAAGVGWGLALLSGWQPEALGWLAAEVPGGGLVRDGSRLLGLAAPLLVLLVGHGTAALLTRVPDPDARPLLAGVLCVGVLATLPDAAWGGTGRLQAVPYPESWVQVRAEVGDGGGRDVLVLPYSSYRAPDWNGGRKVLDPLGRYLKPDYLSSDDLFVANVRIPGEDPRARRISHALATDTGAALEAELAGEGIGTVVTDLNSGGETPDLSAEPVRIGELTVLQIPDADVRATPGWWRWAMGAAWIIWLFVPMSSIFWHRQRDLRLAEAR